MSELLNKINSLLDEAIKSEEKTLQLYRELWEESGKLENEKFQDVAGLQFPNIMLFMKDVKIRKAMLDATKYHIDFRIQCINEIEKMTKNDEK